VRVTQLDSASFPTVETFVSVTNVTGDPITGLSQSQFSLSEGGTSTQIDPFDIVSSGSGNTDISTALVLDRSGSVKSSLSGPDAEDRLVDAAKQFVSQFGTGDEAEVITSPT